MTDLDDDLDDYDDQADLRDRLVRLGDALDFDDADLANGVLDRLEMQRSRGRSRRWLVAAGLLLVVTAVVSYPDSRHAVARWFGLDGLSVEIDPGLELSVTSPSFDIPGPGESRVVEIEGRQILVSAVSGTLDDELISKTIGSSEQIEEVDVDGHQGLWISGDPHRVLYSSIDDDGGDAVIVERVAGNTLVWQDGDVLLRVEGFDRLADALRFVEGT